MRWLLAVSVWAAVPAYASSILVVPENETAREVAAELAEPFSKAKVKLKIAGPQAPAAACLPRTGSERNRCLAQVGQTSFVDAVLQLGASVKGNRVSVVFQLLSLDDGKLIKREVATGPSNKLAGALRPVVTRLAKAIRPRSAEPKPEPEPKPEVKPVEPEKPEVKPVEPEVKPVEPKPLVSDAPKPTPLEPSKVASEPSVVESPRAAGGGLTVAAWTFTAAAVASAAVAGTFGALGLGSKTDLEKNDAGISALSRSQANMLAAQANSHFSIALGAGIGAGVLGVVAAILWSQT